MLFVFGYWATKPEGFYVCYFHIKDIYSTSSIQPSIPLLSLSELKLSTNLFNRLTSRNWGNLGEVFLAGEFEVSKTRLFGQKCCSELEQVFEQVKISWTRAK